MAARGLGRLLHGKLTDGENCAFLPEVANEEAFAEMTMEVDVGYLRKQAVRFRRRLACHLELYYDRDLCCGDLGMAVHGRAGLAKDSLVTGGLFRHRPACRPQFALPPLFGS